MSSYKPPESSEKEGDKTTDGREVKEQRGLEQLNQLSRGEKAIAVFAIGMAGGVVGYIAFGNLFPDSEFAEVVARELREAGIDAGQLLNDVERFLADLNLLQITGGHRGLVAGGVGHVQEGLTVLLTQISQYGPVLYGVLPGVL